MTPSVQAFLQVIDFSLFSLSIDGSLAFSFSPCFDVFAVRLFIRQLCSLVKVIREHHDQIMEVASWFILFIFISSFFKVDLHLAYKKPINVNNNTAYISVNKLPHKNDNNKAKHIIVRQNQHFEYSIYINHVGNQASSFSFFDWKILENNYNFWLFQRQVSIFSELCKKWVWEMACYTFYLFIYLRLYLTSITRIVKN